MSSPRIAVIIYSMYGHIAKLAESVKAGVEAAGGQAKIYQVPETLPENILNLLHAPPKPDYPIATPETLTQYDGYLLGIPTRYGNMPAQFKAFWDATGQLWASGALAGKYAGIFVSTASMGGGQEATAMNTLSVLAHHGIIYVPLGYSKTFPQLTNLDEVHGDYIPYRRHGSEVHLNLSSSQSSQPTDTLLKPSKLSHMSPPRVAIIIYSMYGHIYTMAESVLVGIRQAGGDAKIYQVPETLTPDVLVKMHAKEKPDLPVATQETLKEYDAFLFGIPTRYGNMPAQWKAFWDHTGQLWTSGALAGKYAGLFVSTGNPGGGQETTGLTFLTTLVHHGIIYVPFGYASGLYTRLSLTEVKGGSPWGSGTFAGSHGERDVSEGEKELAAIQGKAFYEIVSRVQWVQPTVQGAGPGAAL
ncbi:hypothetical protein CVT26_003487 [Gymnopilus dilepis]|uniref:Flavodoxin-like domain-containing protein n=1 Tax=Gymnopilus dilepis TaxID=231916 RepID=A0A409W2Z2_9AGAR|nr:hypothetical protein CVT26_003487 [Gymnopilus dilepis]